MVSEQQDLNNLEYEFNQGFGYEKPYKKPNRYKSKRDHFIKLLKLNQCRGKAVNKKDTLTCRTLTREEIEKAIDLFSKYFIVTKDYGYASIILFIFKHLNLPIIKQPALHGEMFEKWQSFLRKLQTFQFQTNVYDVRSSISRHEEPAPFKLVEF